MNSGKKGALKYYLGGHPVLASNPWYDWVSATYTQANPLLDGE